MIMEVENNDNCFVAKANGQHLRRDAEKADARLREQSIDSAHILKI